MKTTLTLFLSLVALAGAEPQPGDADFPTRNGNLRPPSPYGPVPNASQLKWHALEVYGLVCFDMTYYDWTNTWKIVRELQPDACIFSDVGPDLRWVGNEDGAAGDPYWATLDHSKITPGSADAGVLNSGTRGGPAWIPAEADFPLRIHPKGRFWHPSAKPATAAELIAIRLRITRAAACPALAGIAVYLEPEAARGH